MAETTGAVQGEEGGDTAWDVSFSRISLPSIGMTVGALIGLIVWGMVPSTVLDVSLGGLSWKTLVGWLLLLVLYAGVAGSLNRTHVSPRGEDLLVLTTPLPWFSADAYRRVPLAEVRAVTPYRGVIDNDGVRGIAHQIVHLRRDGGSGVLVRGLPSRRVAVDVAARLRERLGVPEVQIPGQ